MKTLITVLAMASLIAAPTASAQQRTNRAGRTGQSYGGQPLQSSSGQPRQSYQAGQSYEGTYKGYPLSEWYRRDSY
jgi:hypothetical protein